MKSILALVAFALIALMMIGMQSRSQSSGKAGSSEHGKYLVESVAMCIQCHTPHKENGTLIRQQLLLGAAVPVTSPYPGVVWANTAPRIAGLPQYTDEEAIRLLTTGISRNGRPLRPPMPPFRFSEQDAQDIVAFLRSLEE